MKPIDPIAFGQRMAEIARESAPLEGPSLADRLSKLDPDVRHRIYAELSPLECMVLLYAWEFWARPKQRAPEGDYDVLLWLAGRGFGKSQAGSEWVRERVEAGAKEIALIGPSWDDIERYMVGGDSQGRSRPDKSGLIDVCPPWMALKWNAQKKQLVFGAHGAIAYASTAEKPELRGPSPDTVWADELIKWRYPEALWRNIMLALRGTTATGLPCQAAVTTTPRPMKLLKEIIMDPGTRVIQGRQAENTALPRSYVERNKRQLGDTRLGRQERLGEVLGDNPDALFDQLTIDRHRVDSEPSGGLSKVVVAIDPAASKKRKSDDTGIVVEGLGADGDVYVLADATGRYSPEGWGRVSVDLFDDWGASAFVVERNKIGDLAASNIRAAYREKHGKNANPPIEEVEARASKEERAEPVSTLYVQGHVHHVGRHQRLEDEMTEWDPKTTMSPNGLDALVHGVYDLTDIGEEIEPEPDLADFEEAQEGFGAQSEWGGDELL